MVKGHQVQMASRTSEIKDEDVEQQSARLLQSDVASVRRDFKLKLTVLDIIEEGHKAAAVAIASSIVDWAPYGHDPSCGSQHPRYALVLLCDLQHENSRSSGHKASMPWCDACTI